MSQSSTLGHALCSVRSFEFTSSMTVFDLMGISLVHGWLVDPQASEISSHHITSHHITSHHITSHHITSHHIT